MVLHCACDKKLLTNLVRVFKAHGHGYVAVNFLFQLIFVFTSLAYITIYTQKQWKNKN